MKTYATEAEKLVLEELRAIYVNIPKTGCTSVKKFFSSYYNWKVVENVHQRESDIYSYIINKDISSKKYDEFYKFSFVRNPFSRLYSAFKDKIKPGIEHPVFIDCVEIGLYKLGLRKEHSFSQFVNLVCSTPSELLDLHVKPQWQFIFTSDNEKIVNDLYRFEDFSAEMLRLTQRLGIHIKLEDIPHENRAQVRLDEYKQFYDIDTITAVAKRYDKDFEIFGYHKTI